MFDRILEGTREAVDVLGGVRRIQHFESDAGSDDGKDCVRKEETRDE